jgi:hypothetical protein
MACRSGYRLLEDGTATAWYFPPRAWWRRCREVDLGSAIPPRMQRCPPMRLVTGNRRDSEIVMNQTSRGSKASPKPTPWPRLELNEAFATQAIAVNCEMG